MGTLINPLSRILGHKKQIFWANNYSFHFSNVIYRQKIFQIRTFKRLFKYLLRYLTKLFKFPRVYYSLSLNFIGQANNILDIKLYIHNISNYNIASLLLGYDSIKLIPVLPFFKRRNNFRWKLRSRLQKLFDMTSIRYSKIFLKWRSMLITLLLQKLDNQARLTTKSSIPGHLRSIRKRKLRSLMSLGLKFKITKFEKNILNNRFNLKFFKSYIVFKFRLLRANLRLYKSMNSKFFMDLITFFFNSFIPKIAKNFEISKIKLNFRRKKIQPATLVRSINNFCYLALRKGYRINYVIKVIRITVRYIKKVRGFKMIVSGRFYRRGRAMFRVSQWGEVGSQTGRNYLIYRNSQRIKEYGMCSVKLLFFFRRNFKHFSKIPLRTKWFNYLKYLRSNYKIRQEFGYIRY